VGRVLACIGPKPRARTEAKSQVQIVAEFVTSAAGAADFPRDRLPEVALVGRSNVGKSSLINALTGRHALARISRTPGRTQELIFFTGAGKLSLVDMPGYGYAAAARHKIAAWTQLIQEFLRGRASLARVYLLIDARHGPKNTDEEALGALDEAGVSYQVVLTKADEVKDHAPLLAETAAAMAAHPAAHPELLLTSARTGLGIAELRAAISRLLAERGIKL
jgi:GTP-binding protein